MRRAEAHRSALSRVHFRGLVSALDLCPKPQGLDPYDVVTIIDPEEQDRMRGYKGLTGMLWEWRTDMCMWKVRLLGPGETRESVISEERVPGESTGRYVWLPSTHVEKVSGGTLRDATPAMEPPSSSPRSETRVFPTEDGRWQIEYPDHKVAFSHLILRHTGVHDLHLWTEGGETIQEDLQAGEELGWPTDDPLRPRPNTRNWRMLRRRERARPGALPTFVRPDATTSTGGVPPYMITTGDIIGTDIVFASWDLDIRDGMFVRKSAQAEITKHLNAAKAHYERGDAHEAARSISCAIAGYGDIDDVPAELYKTRASYWRKMEEKEANVLTKRRYGQYVRDDISRAETRAGTYQVGNRWDPVVV